MEAPVTKLTNWKKEPTIGDLKKNIDDAMIEQGQHLVKVDRWLDNLYITGKAKLPKTIGSSSIVPKVILKQAEWRYAALSEPFLSTPDIFKVKPKTAGDRKRAQQNELVLNNQFNTKIKKVDFIDSYVRDAVDIGTVIVKVGWEFQEEEVTVTEPVYDFQADMSGQYVEQYTQLLQLKMAGGDEYADHSNPGLDKALEVFAMTGHVLIPQQIGETKKTELVETKNHPTVETCFIENIILDPSCNGDLNKANFIGERFKSSLAALKKDGKYKNLDKINVEAASPIADPDYKDSDNTGNFNFEDSPKKQFVVHQWWGNWDVDGSGTPKPIVAAWVGEVMIRMEENPFPDRKHPFIKAVYRPMRKSLYGEPDGELLEDNQLIIGAVSRGMIDLLGKSANGQTGFKRGLLDTTNQRKFKRGEDYEFNNAMDPRQGIYTHTYPEIPQSAYNVITMQNAEAESLSGVKAFNTGITGNALGDSVANARSVLDAASKREVGILRRLAQGIIEIGRKFISMNAEFLSEEEVIRITDEEFITVRRDDLAGNFDLRLTISTPEEDERNAEQLGFMLQTMGNNMDPELSKMILSDIARLRKMPDMAKKIEDYQPQPDPMVVMEQELRIKLLEAQIAKEEALAAKHSTEAGVNQTRAEKEYTQAGLNVAKSNTEQAKARQMSSDADNKDLNYLEQSEGVLQARDIEKMQVKNQGDAQLRVLDKALTDKENV